MNKRLTALVLSVSIAAAPLTSFAKEDIPNIEINNTYNSDFAYDLQSTDLQSIQDSNISEVSLHNPTVLNEQDNILDLENDNVIIQNFDVNDKTVDVTKKRALTKEQINGTDDDDNYAEDEVNTINAERTDGEILIKSSDTSHPLRAAATTPSDTQNRLQNINTKDSFALQNQTGRTSFVGDNIGTEYIDPLTGNLIVTETDLVLPGVDGLDLKLQRYYSLAEAEVFTKSAGVKIDPKTFIMPADSYVVTETVYNTETRKTSTYKYPYASRQEAELRVEEIESRDTCNGLYIYSATWDICSEGDEVDVNYYYTSDITSSGYSRIRNNLGAGWSWSFPSVQPIKDNYNDYNEFEMPKAIYYHDGKGNVMEVEYDRLNGCSFTNHIGEDITFEIIGDYDTNICNSARIDYMVEDENCTQYYFGPHGEIRTIMDIHGNKITFGYTDKSFYGADEWPIISNITDTVGRQVSFQYYQDGDTETIVATVTSPFETGKNLSLTYTKEMIGFSKGDEALSSEPVLTSVTNSIGETTHYSPAIIGGERSYVQPIEFTFADKSFDSTYLSNTSGTQNNYVYLLGNIIRPHSNTYYEYKITERNLGHSGVSESYVVAERGDYELTVYNNKVSESYDKNCIRYRYSRDYTGYPYYHSISAAPNNRYICRFTERRNQSTVSQEYYKLDDAVLLKYTTENYPNSVGNNLTISSEVLDYLMKQPIRTKIDYSNGSYSYTSYVQTQFESNTSSKAFGKPELITEEVDEETVEGANREKHAITYTYDSRTGAMLSKSWYRDYSTKCTEQYNYTADNRLSRVKKANGTITTYTYEKTSGGKVSKKTTTVTNGSESCVTEENYSSATGYTYPDSVVKKVTANGTQTSDTTTYTYNMLLGVVTSKTDSNGTTYFEYDNLSRPTRIVYPKYAAYSDYNEKDIDILPVKNINYVTVSRNDYAGISDATEKLITQAVQTTTRYYNVSDITSDNPTDTELSNCGIYYVSDEVNYYMGTGELIESNVLDKVNETNAYVKTIYIYNTVNNTITTIDNSGNTTIDYYDDLGREIKATDMFGNSHVTEYNRNSEDIGFKALSYLIPASDSNAKENIIEYTYDRLNRVTSEKAYENYPDSFSETKYSYDIAGNIIGTIDANNNLNSNGYTTSYTYDKLNRVISSKNANDEVLTNTYDVFDNIKTQTLADKDGNTSVLYNRVYNGEGNILSDTDNSSNSNTYSYNASGQLEQSTDKNGKITNYEYNSAGTSDRRYIVKAENSLEDEQYAQYTPFGASRVIKFEAAYDENNSSYRGSCSEIRSISYSPTGKILSDKAKYYTQTGIDNVYFYPEAQYKYDSYGNIISSTFACIDDVNEKKWVTSNSYEYDKNRISKVQIPSGTKAEYTFYDDGKLKSVTYPALSDGSILKSEYTYDGLSRLKTLVNKKGTSVLSSYSYTYDSNGNILTANESVGNNTNNTTYSYDKLNRITSVIGTKNADSYYEYDYRGNRKVNFEQTDFLSENSASYRYDMLENMCYSKTGNNTTVIKYGTNGYRYVKRENSELPEYYIYDQQGRLQTEVTFVNATVNDTKQIIMYPKYQYIWGPDKVLAQFDVLNNAIYYYLYNGHGDVIQIVDTDGNIVNSYDYDVWGNFISKEETIHNPFTYFGQTYDEATGLYYLRARYYDPTTGRFTQQDSAEDGYNWYVYGNQNPILYVDPTGENWIYNAWNWGEDNIWKGIAKGVDIYGWHLSAELLRLSASGSGHTYIATSGDYASNLAKNDYGINKKVNDIIWDYGTSTGNRYISTPKISYEIPLGNGDLGAALHWVSIQVNASQQRNGSWSANVTITDDFDFTEFKNPFKQGSILKGFLWAANDIAYIDTEWGLLDNVKVIIKYSNYY